VHTIQVQNEDVNSWHEVYVDAHSGEILSATDYVADATVCCYPRDAYRPTENISKYTVLPFFKESIPQGIETLVDPQDPLASPSGWHTFGTTTTNTTS